MNLDYSTYINDTTYCTQISYSHFNEDVHCDNEVNLILEKTSRQQLTKKIIDKQQSTGKNQNNQYYFTPIREQNSTTNLTGNNVTDSLSSSSSSLLLSDLQYPSTINLFDDFSSNTFLSIMNSSDRLSTVNKQIDTNKNDVDISSLLMSSLLPVSPNNTFDEVFLNQMTDLVCSSSPTSMIDQQQAIGPPPGFENFHRNSSLTTNNMNNSTISTINNVAKQTFIPSDTINFSQLLQSTTIVDPQEQQLLIPGNVGNIHSSSSSHSSFTSDDQSNIFPISTHPYSSSYATSQIFSTNKISSPTATTNSVMKSHIPNSLSLNNNNNNNFSSVSLNTNSTIGSPVTTTTTINENEKRIIDGDITSSHIFSFLNNGHTDCSSSSVAKFPSNILRTSSSSTSSSTTSSIDDALIHLSQQQQNLNKLYPNESASIFNLSKPNLHQQQQAVHDNINFLASMANTTPTPSMNSKRNKQVLRKNIHEFIESLNESCYKGFDDLNALIQEQRWVQTYVNVSSSLVSPTEKLNNSNCCSSRILIVCEYFIFKCKKIEITASQVFELLANGRMELRLNDLLFIFKSWKESIINAEKIHQEEENKLRLSIEHPQSYYMTDTVLESTFSRIAYAIQQLCHLTQQARAAFQHATLNVFQITSRQQSQPANSTVLAQMPTIQQHKPSSIIRMNGSTRTTP